MKLLRVIIAAGVLAWVSHARADAPYSLTWVRGEGAEGCPGREAFVDEVIRNRGTDPFEEGGKDSVFVSVERRGATWRAEVRIARGEGGDSKSTLESNAESCDGVVSATALAVSLALGEPLTKGREALPVALEGTEAKAVPLSEEKLPLATAEPRRQAVKGGEEQPRQRYDNWIGLEVAQDFTVLGESDACSPGASPEFTCFDGAHRYSGSPRPDVGSQVRAGYLMATTRLLGTFERALSKDLGAMLRAGWAFGDTANRDGVSFLPVHAELDVLYWFAGAAYGGRGVKAYAFLGGGLAQVDASVGVDVTECPDGACDVPEGGTIKHLTAYRHGGRLFGTLGIGGLWTFTERTGLSFRLGGLLMAPATAFVMQPSVGIVTGF